MEGKLFKKLCTPFLITYTMVSGNLFPHTCTPTHNTLPKKKSYVACFFRLRKHSVSFCSLQKISNPKSFLLVKTKGKGTEWDDEKVCIKPKFFSSCTCFTGHCVFLNIPTACGIQRGNTLPWLRERHWHRITQIQWLASCLLKSLSAT